MRMIDLDVLITKIDELSQYFEKPREATISLDALYDMIVDDIPTVAEDTNVPDKWVSVKDRMPENANKPGAFCPRYLVMTKYGVTEGWYNPDKGCWYVLLWFMFRYVEEDINLERADKPGVASNVEVTHWMPLPEPPKGDETNAPD